MLNNVVQRFALRPLIVSAISFVLLMSLLCSLALQQSYAGGTIAAAADELAPLRTGQSAPSFTVRTADNEEFRFDPDALEEPVLIITFRGGWCPYCNMHLSELHRVVPEISAMGIDILFLSGDRPDQLYASLEANTRDQIAELDYRIYSDADAQAAIAFGIAFAATDHTINRRYEKGQDIADSSMLRRGTLPVPAVYAIDRSGLIRFDFVEANYKIRLPADELLAVARELVAQ